MSVAEEVQGAVGISDYLFHPAIPIVALVVLIAEVPILIAWGVMIAAKKIGGFVGAIIWLMARPLLGLWEESGW